MKSALAVPSRLLALGLAAVLGLAPVLSAQSAGDDASAGTDRQRPASTDRQRPGSTDRPGSGSVTVPGIGDLPAGKSIRIVFRASVDAGPFAAGKDNLSNQGTVSGGNFPATLTDDPAFPGAADPTLTPLDARPDLSLTKSDGGASVAAGGTVAYTLGYSNTGSQGATGVVLTETVPANTTFNAGASTAGWACTPNNNAGSTCTLALGALAATGSGSATFSVTVVNPVPAGVTQVSNTASVADDGTNGADPTPGNNSASDTTPVDAAPDLALTKSDGGASVAPGGTVAYALGYSNAGGQGATGVVLTETVPANTTFNAGASTAGWACTPNNNAGSTCTLAVGALAGGGASGAATFAVTAVNPVPAGVSQVSNTASVADDGANGADPTPGNNSASDTTPVDAAPDLALTKSDGGVSTAPGGTVAYALGYSNTGNQGATGVALTETVPANTTFNAGASTAGWACTPNNNAGSSCTLALGALAAGGSGNATFAVTVVNPVPAGVTQVSNTAGVADDGANGADPTPGNNSASDTTPVDAAPDLALTKGDGGVSTTPGGTVAYALGYSNTGNQGATGVALTETVPANTTFNAGASTAGWACTPNGNAGSTCTLALGALAAGGAPGSATFAVTVDNPVPAGVTQVSNTASVADDGANGPDPTPANNTASDTTPITAAPDLTLTKSDGGATTTPGGTVAYTLGYANVGTRGATGVFLSETVPANATFNPGASTAGWSCVPDNNPGSACTLNVGSLVAGGSGNATFAVTVVSPVPAGVSQVSNTAGVADDGANGADPTPGNNSASDTTPVDAAPDLALTKGDGGVSTTPGGTVAYALGYSNTGNQGATGVALTETVPANTTFNAGASTAGWACTPNGNAGSTCTLAVGALAASGSGNATFAVTVDSPVPAGVTQVSNTASLADDGANGPDPTPGNNTASDTTPITAVPDLTLGVTDNRVAAHAGQVLTYVLTYQNVGSQDATGVVLSDVVPQGTTFFDPAGTSGWSCAHGAPPTTNCTYPVPGGVAAGAPAATRSFRVRVDKPLAAATFILNDQVSVADDGANGADPTPANNDASDTNTVVTPKGDMNRPAPRATSIARTDLLFQNDASARVVAWFMDYTSVPAPQAVQGGGTFTTPVGPADTGLRVAGTDDFDDDGLTDILFRHATTGALQVWLMDGMLQKSAVAPTPSGLADLTWRLEATGDLNGDGQADLVWRNRTSGNVVAWLMNGLTRTSGQLVTGAAALPDPWKVVGSGDLNLAADSNVDLLVANTSTGALQAWLTNGALAVASVAPIAPATLPAGWEVAAVGDYNVDGQTDIVLRNVVSAKMVVWFMNGTARSSGAFTSPDAPSSTEWRLVGPK